MNTGPFFIMLAASLWAIDALIRTPLTKTISATNIVFWEHVVGFVLLTPFFFRVKNFWTKLTKIDWVYIFALTVVSSIGGTILFTLALEKSFSVGDFITPLLLQKTQPLIVIALSAIFLHEKITRKYLLLVPVALLGSYLMSFGANAPNLIFAGKEQVFMLALGAAFCWGSGTILSKKILTKLTFLESTCIRFLAAIPLGLIVAASFGQTPTIISLNPDSLFRFTLIGLTTGAGALLIYYKGLAKTQANVSTISELTFPLVSIFIAITPLNPYGSAQILKFDNVVGIIMLIIAVLVISFDYAKKNSIINFSGVVVKGTGDGKKIGFPTANIEPEKNPQISYGVYSCITTIGKNEYKGILHFGPRLVFGENKPRYEIHILNFNKNIYHKKVDIQITKFIRPTQKFASVKKMIVQIKKDVEIMS
ncbi:riboflavin kinase [Patescibacteria group bacterium]